MRRPETGLYPPETDEREVPDLDPRPTADEVAERDTDGRIVKRYVPWSPVRA